MDGYKIGFAGCRETTWLERKSPMANDLKALKKAGCDVIIYSATGARSTAPPTTKSRSAWRITPSKNGADIVVGTHPHCVQGIEKRGGGVVIYSLGNLVFGGTHEMTTFDALIVQAVLAFDEDGYEGVTLRLLAGAHLWQQAR